MDDLSVISLSLTRCCGSTCASQSVTDLEVVAKELGLHALAVEDAVDARQRPKLDRYDRTSSEHVRGPAGPRQRASSRLSEISAFITRQTLVTVRKDRTFDMDAVVARWDASRTWPSTGWGSCSGV